MRGQVEHLQVNQLCGYWLFMCSQSYVCVVNLCCVSSQLSVCVFICDDPVCSVSQSSNVVVNQLVVTQFVA